MSNYALVGVPETMAKAWSFLTANEQVAVLHVLNGYEWPHDPQFLPHVLSSVERKSGVRLAPSDQLATAPLAIRKF